MWITFEPWQQLIRTRQQDIGNQEEEKEDHKDHAAHKWQPNKVNHLRRSGRYKILKKQKVICIMLHQMQAMI